MLKAIIQNVITTADLGQEVDGQRFVKFDWGVYDTECYGGRCGYVKDNEIRGRVTVFLTGKMISTGAKSVKESTQQLQRAMHLLVENHFIKNVKLFPKIQNILATVNSEHKLDIHVMASQVPMVTFEPEQFPAAILRMDHRPSCLLFASGKIVIAGAKSERELSAAVYDLEKLLKSYYILGK